MKKFLMVGALACVLTTGLLLSVGVISKSASIITPETEQKIADGKITIQYNADPGGGTGW
jgi:hypothetical protein